MGNLKRTSFALLAVLVAPFAGAAQEAPGTPMDLLRQDGAHGFEIPLRDSVSVCGWTRSRESGGARERNCSESHALVILDVEDGRFTKFDVEPLPKPGQEPSHKWRTPDRIHGPFSADALKTFFVEMAENQPDELAEDALGVLGLVDGLVVWPELERFAGDRSRSGEFRSAALFWLSQETHRKVVSTLESVARADEDEIEVREAAVFALTQQTQADPVPILMDLVESTTDPDLIRTTLFWLAQEDDPRVLTFFGDLLRQP